MSADQLEKPRTTLAVVSPGALFELPGVSSDLDITYVDPMHPQVSVFDLAVIRGDGIFEATTVWKGTPLAWKLHIWRLSNSARLADYPRLRVDGWLEAARQIIEHHNGEFGDADSQIRVLVTRGMDPETRPGRAQGAGTPHVFIYMDQRDPAHPHMPDEVRLLSLPKGVASSAAQDAPWMLWGVKTLSYAMNMATYRYLHAHDADETIFYSTDGYLLEAATASVVLRIGDEYVTSDPSLGILAGTTQREFFAYLEHQGLKTRYGKIPTSALLSADAIWTMGGSTIHTVKSIDGRPLRPDIDMMNAANSFVRENRELIEKSSLAGLDWSHTI